MQTPRSIRPSLLHFCNSIVVNQQPLYVEVNPLLNQPVNECFTVIPKHIATHGGKQIFGWTIWEWLNVMVEAEFHTIWCTDDVMVDISPKEDDIMQILFRNKVLFLPDPCRKYEGRQVDNIRKPLRGDKRIRRFCQMAHDLFLATNEGDLAYKREFHVTPRIQKIRNDMLQLYMSLTRKYGE